MWTCRAGDLNITSALMEAKADLTWRNRVSVTAFCGYLLHSPLCLSSSFSSLFSLSLSLSLSSLSLSFTLPQRGDTPLSLAVSSEQKAIVRLLLTSPAAPAFIDLSNKVVTAT